MYSSYTSLVLLGLALAWTALNKSGIPAFDWYVSLLFTGLAMVAFWVRPRRRICPQLPGWIAWTIRGLLLYCVLQAIPLPLSILQILSPARAALTRAVPAVAAAPISVDPAAHILWFLTLAGCVGVFFLTRDLTYRLQNRLFLAVLPLVLVASLEGVLGLFQIASGAEQAVGSYNSRDHYCCILEMCLPVTLAFGLHFFGFRNEKQASIWPVVKAISCWLACALLTLGILFSLSRTGWIDSLMALLLLTLLLLLPRVQSSGWRIGLVVALGAAFLAIFIFASPGAMLTRLVATLTPDAEGRTHIWHDLLPLTRDYRWFGTGLMGFDPVFLKYQSVINAKRIDFAHNDFLQYLIELGLIGFVPLMASAAGIIWPIAKGAWRGKSSNRVLLGGCTAALFALFLHSLVDFNLYVPANVLTFAWILGFGSALAALQMRGPEEPLSTDYEQP